MIDSHYIVKRENLVQGPIFVAQKLISFLKSLLKAQIYKHTTPGKDMEEKDILICPLAKAMLYFSFNFFPRTVHVTTK